MKTFYTAASAAALAFCLSAPAGAVDLSNPGYGDDMVTTHVTITENGQARSFVLDYGMIEYNVCSSECTIHPLGGKAVTASGYDMVEVLGSSAKVYKFDSYATQFSQIAQLPNEETQDQNDALAAPDVAGGDDNGEADGGQTDN